MKITYSRARQLEIATSVYSLARGSRPNHHAEKDSGSRVRRSGSDHPVFRKALSYHCDLIMFGNSEVSLSLLSLCFVIIIKYSRAQRETQAIIPPSSSLSIALELNSYFEWLSFLFAKYSILLSKSPPNLSLNRNSSPNELGYLLILGVNSLLRVIGVSFQLYSQLKKSPHNSTGVLDSSAVSTAS